ncbi:DUF1592 domain-containing protein [Stieleria varia]|uniref:DUF1592 domain-containing protein n=1 Tax=Stieleria varia TaxID=2528005 RepID=UPI0011B6CC05|nr:DUF1592 domain-containing protein [Stieleria varia]
MILSFGIGIQAGEPSGDLAAPAQANATSESSNESSDHSRDALKNWKATGWPLMQQFCIDCHSEDNLEAGLDLSGFETLDSNATAVTARVLEMVRFGAMPPDDSELPSIDERKRFVDSIESTLYAVGCDLTPKSGKVTARRLNRAEYNHSVRDLFGIDIQPADDFPSDEVGAGFDNNGDVLSLSPMLLEKYMAAAERVASAAIVDPDTLPRLDLDVAPDRLPVYGNFKVGSFNGRFLDKESFIWLDIKPPFAGEYRISVRGGNTLPDDKPRTVAIFDAAGILRATGELKYYGGSGGSESFSAKLDLPAGEQRLFFDVIHDDRELVVGESRFEELDRLDGKRMKSVLEKLSTPVPPERNFDKSDHPFMFRAISIDGPSRYEPDVLPPFQSKLVRRVAPRRRGRYSDVSKTAAYSLQPLMRLAFRGPVSDDDVAPYAQLVEMATDQGESFYVGMQVAISAILVSPRFLYRVETPPADAKPDDSGDVALTQHQLATRLAYFLWSSTPDDELLQAADKGRLDEAMLRSQITRMLRDPKSDALASQFAAQWLGLRNLEEHTADAEKFPALTPSLRNAMARETELLFLDVLHENKPVSEFLTADYTFVDRELAKHYELDFDADGFQRVSLAATPRRGLLAHAGILTLTSSPTRTSPVKRGKWILENILGTPPPEPPAGVPLLDEAKVASADATFREQLELHRQSPTCASCHRVMDQLGFGLDQFDAIGRFRTMENGHPIDSSGEMPDGREFNSASELSRMLSQSEQTAFSKTLTRRLLTFAIGRELAPTDRCVIDQIMENTREDNHRLVDLITQVVLSRPFRFQTPATEN